MIPPPSRPDRIGASHWQEWVAYAVHLEMEIESLHELVAQHQADAEKRDLKEAL